MFPNGNKTIKGLENPYSKRLAIQNGLTHFKCSNFDIDEYTFNKAVKKI